MTRLGSQGNKGSKGNRHRLTHLAKEEEMSLTSIIKVVPY